MSKYASGTDVPAEKSRMEIERTLTRYGADEFGVLPDGRTFGEWAKEPQNAQALTSGAMPSLLALESGKR